MSLQSDIKNQIKDAMLSKDSVRLTVLRGLSSAFVNQLVADKRTPQEELSDEDALNVIRRAVKQRKDSIEQFEKGGRPELAEDEKAELAVLEKFLPKMMSKEEIQTIAAAKKAEMGITDPAKMGIFMGALMKELKGKADGADVKEVVELLFR
ncbi:MAG: GatB/YqeY domain-containing protein [Candidatus Pacebacteria bacterium]|nr:GatB/YqeY domain-containing protein [Candidatus Paceibacterota bacterium]